MRAPLVPAVLTLGLGIAVGLTRPAPSWGGPFLVALALAGMLVAARGMARRTPGGLPLALRPLLPLFLMAGVLLGVAVRTGTDRSCLQRLPVGPPLSVRGTVVDVTGDRLLLRVDTVRANGRSVACRAELPGRWAGSGAELRPGAAMAGRGRWWSPPDRRTPVGRSGLLLLEAVETGAPGRPGLGPRLRALARSRVDRVFPTRADLAASLLLAQRDRLDRGIRERYARAGLSHLLAISGLHVGLLAGMFLLLARLARLGRRAAAAAAAGATIAYVALIGAPVSAVRAALQIVLLLVARAVQRPTRSEAVVAAAGLALLAVDPSSLVRPGFQLSFAGVVGILVLRRPLLDRFGPLGQVRVAGVGVGGWLADGLATSAGAVLATAPVVGYHFGQVPLVGVAANLVAIPLLAAAVPALALAVTVGWVSPGAGRFVAGGGEAILAALDGVADLASRAPLASLSTTPVGAVTVTTAIAVGFAASRRLGRVRTALRLGVWAAAGAAVLAVAPIRPSGGLEIHLIDVGQGDAVALRSPGGRWLLVDAGVATDRYDAGERRVVPYLKARGVRRLEGLVVTHPDADHMGGAGAVIRALRPRWVGGPGLAVGKAAYLELLRAARTGGAAWAPLRRGEELALDGMTVTVLHPPDGRLAVGDVNDASVVLRVVHGRFEALLTGDASTAVEQELVARLGSGLEADVLKLGHHGSATSTSPALLRATGARTALVSAGRGNRYGHPHAVVLARIRHHGLDVYRTDLHGTVVVRGSAAGTVRVRTERGSR